MVGFFMKDSYGPYFEAIRKILCGEPVKKLEEIRKQCNENFLKDEGGVEEYPDFSSYVLSFLADAENKILMGENPVEAYNVFDKSEVLVRREDGRLFLEDMVGRYLHV